MIILLKNKKKKYFDSFFFFLNIRFPKKFFLYKLLNITYNVISNTTIKIYIYILFI